MEKEYYVEFTSKVLNNNVFWDYTLQEDYDYIWAKSKNDAVDTIKEIYGEYVDITLIEEYEDK